MTRPLDHIMNLLIGHMMDWVEESDSKRVAACCLPYGVVVQTTLVLPAFHYSQNVASWDST